MRYVPFPRQIFNAYQRGRELPARGNPCRCRDMQNSRIVAVDSLGFLRKFDTRDWYFEKVTVKRN